MEQPSLVAVVGGLEPALRRRLSDFAIRFLSDEEAEVTLRFALATGGRLRSMRNPWSIGFEPLGPEADLRRWKTATARIPLTPSIHQQLRDLERSGLAGGLRPARRRGGSDFSQAWPSRPWGSPHEGTWRFLAHAGSTSERRAWLQRLIAEQDRIQPPPEGDAPCGNVPYGTFPHETFPPGKRATR